MEIKHILLTTDFSDFARLAYPHARYLADKLGARVTLFHVREQLHFGTLPPNELQKYDAALGEAFSRQIVRERDACAAMDLRVEVRSGLGTPSREILSYVEAHDVDLVILTSHGSRGPRSLLFGSTTKRVVRHIDIPFLLVPADAEAVEVGFRPYRKVLATTDFSGDSQRGLDVALGLAARLEAHLTLAHVLLHPAAVPGIAGEPPAFVPTETLDWLMRHHRQVLEDIREEKGEQRMDCWIDLAHDAPEGIVNAAEQLDCDLIVVPSHGKGALRAVLFGSNSEHVLNLSPLPVLVLPRSFLKGV